MTTPVSPGGPASGEPSSPDRDPWAPPSAEGVAHEPPRAPYAPAVGVAQPSNGMGVAALVLGLVGCVLGVFIFLFWMSWVPAVLAVIFGGVGLSRARSGRVTNKGMSVAGLVLGIIGLVMAVASLLLTVVLVDEARTHIKEVKTEQRAQKKAAEESAAAEEKARHLSFGEPYTFENGLKVTVAKPEPFEPDAFAHGHAKGNKAVQVTVTVVNTSSKRVSVDTGLPDVNDAKGASAELVIDGSGRQKVITGYLLPGKEAVGKYAFSLPADAADRMEVEFTPDASEWDDAYWSGPTS
ncbi:DUF4190 domain-containing protein [Streptomyces sp. WZ-12]|uniref:DUF4190 domain-containing protein n=1 Tax=Streptomyces sp. WZ-12 TaxID=3030210 RepID=UPI0023812C4E|nr:DUF4190 domain-containing protein [Streptomyces sp. WZ-12]